MALNWVTVVDGKPLLLQGEHLIEIVDNVKCNLTIPDAPPSTSSSAGGSGGLKKLEANGTLALTDQRLVWTNPDTQSSFTSLTIPLSSILSSRFEQPVFGANYLALTIKPTADGGLTEGTTLEIRFLDTGMFKFVSVLAKTREKAIFMRRRSIEDEENLPEYSSAGTSTGGPVPQYTDLPPGYDS
ncbi:hypothetical protein PAXINDRAFT_166478 [Paxillus involutus ATCC 200175]|nr:hypothetical protein PAXINDRAFT_166478 [Paxillus involutus ATCC 200175]